MGKIQSRCGIKLVSRGSIVSGAKSRNSCRHNIEYSAFRSSYLGGLLYQHIRYRQKKELILDIPNVIALKSRPANRNAVQSGFAHVIVHTSPTSFVPYVLLHVNINTGSDVIFRNTASVNPI